MLEDYVDIYEPEQYISGVPHHKYKHLREHAPIVFQREESGPGYWALLKHADVLWASKRLVGGLLIQRLLKKTSRYRRCCDKTFLSAGLVRIPIEY